MMKMSNFNLFESIKQGLNEAVEFEKGNLPDVKVRKTTIAPLNNYDSLEIKKIKAQKNISQKHQN